MIILRKLIIIETQLLNLIISNKTPIKILIYINILNNLLYTDYGKKYKLKNYLLIKISILNIDLILNS